MEIQLIRNGIILTARNSNRVEYLLRLGYKRVVEEAPENVEIPADADEDEEVSLSTRTISELRNIAREREVEGFSGLNKAELVALLEG